MKVTNQEKPFIRLKSKRFSVEELAEEYQVTKQYIYRILSEENDLAFSILLKMIPIFVEQELKVNLSDEEIDFIKRIYQEGSK